MITKLRQSVVHYLLVGALCLCSGELYSDEAKTLYFHNPEVNTARNTVLKGTFDKFLLSHGNYQFQPVEEKTLFEQVMLSEGNAAFIMSSQHFQQMVDDNPGLSERYHSVLQGEKGGNDTYHKLLISKTANPNFENGVLASSRERSFSLRLLREMFPKKPTANIEKVKFLEVPKDIDALMAVGFGLADMALATDESFAVLSALYDEQYPKMLVVGKTPALKRMVFVLPRYAQNLSTVPEDLVAQMPLDPLGKRALKLLGLDAWTRISAKQSDQGGQNE